jgi:acid phosphatase
VTRRVLACAALLLAAACTSSARPPSHSAAPRLPSAARGLPSRSVDGAAATAVPRFAHLVVVVEENRSYSDVLGNRAAPFINGLARTGVVLTNSYGVRHPSEPNYLALFSGSTHGLTDDSCPRTYAGNNLASQLRAHGQSFVGYAESLPQPGFLGCSAGPYARKHAPWTDFKLPASLGVPMTAFPGDYSKLPRVAFVIPNVDSDMHDGTIAAGDTWLRSHLGSYVSWARTHNSLLIVTWDEDDFTATNRIPGVFVGAHLRPGRYARRVDHYTMLRTIEAACGLPAIGRAADRAPISTVWAP